MTASSVTAHIEHSTSFVYSSRQLVLWWVSHLEDVTWADHELQRIWRGEMQWLNTKNKNVPVRLMYVACSMWHSLYLQRFTQSWADKRCMHSVSPLSATRFASISIDMCARISCKRVPCSVPHDSCVDVCHSSFWLSRYFVPLALMFRGQSHNLNPLAPH